MSGLHSGFESDLDFAQLNSMQDGQLVFPSFPMFISTLMHGNIYATVTFMNDLSALKQKVEKIVKNLKPLYVA